MKSSRTLHPLATAATVALALLIGALSIRLLQRPSDTPEPAATHPAVGGVAPEHSPVSSVTDNVAQIDTDELDIGQLERLLAALPSQSLDRQAETLQHLANLVEDAAYAPLATWTADARTPAPLLEILMEDLFNREDETKLPIFRSIADNPAHPFQSLAVDVLEIYAPQPDAATLAQESPEVFR